MGPIGGDQGPTGRAVFQKTDVSDSAQVKALVDRAGAEFGSLDVAFNNAGVLPPTAPLAEQSQGDWHRVIGVDVTGVFLGMKHPLSHMAKAGHGVIVNTASVAVINADPWIRCEAALRLPALTARTKTRMPVTRSSI